MDENNINININDEENIENNLIHENDINIDNNIEKINSESSIISTFNSDKYMETYGKEEIENIKIREINLSEESQDSDYSEEINEDEITAFENELLSKT